MIISEACQAITEALSLHNKVYDEGYRTGLKDGQEWLAPELTIEHHMRLLEDESAPKSPEDNKPSIERKENEPLASPSFEDVEHEDAMCAGYIMGWLRGATGAMEPWMKEGQAKP